MVTYAGVMNLRFRNEVSRFNAVHALWVDCVVAAEGLFTCPCKLFLYKTSVVIRTLDFSLLRSFSFQEIMGVELFEQEIFDNRAGRCFRRPCIKLVLNSTYSASPIFSYVREMHHHRFFDGYYFDQAHFNNASLRCVGDFGILLQHLVMNYHKFMD